MKQQIELSDAGRVMPAGIGQRECVSSVSTRNANRQMQSFRPIGGISRRGPQM